MPGIVDLSELASTANGVAKVVLESVQEMLLRVALQIARDDYEDRRERQRQGVELAKQAGKYKSRRPDAAAHARIIALREDRDAGRMQREPSQARMGARAKTKDRVAPAWVMRKRAIDF